MEKLDYEIRYELVRKIQHGKLYRYFRLCFVKLVAYEGKAELPCNIPVNDVEIIKKSIDLVGNNIKDGAMVIKKVADIISERLNDDLTYSLLTDDCPYIDIVDFKDDITKSNIEYLIYAKILRDILCSNIHNLNLCKLRSDWDIAVIQKDNDPQNKKLVLFYFCNSPMANSKMTEDCCITIGGTN